MKKILLINVNWIGDVIFSTPALRALREYYPQARITCLVVERCKDVLKNNPRVDEIIVYDEFGKHRGLIAKLRFIFGLRKKKFDSVYILHPALKRAMIGWLSGIPERVGYSTKGRAFLLTRAIPPPDALMHKIDYFLYLLEKCGISSKNRACEFFLSKEDTAQAEAILKKNGISDNDKFVVLNPGGNWMMKRWPPRHFAQLSDMLGQRFKLRVVIAGGGKDRSLAEDISAMAKERVVMLTGKTSLHQLAAIMKKALCVVTADSGPMHIAAACGANTLALFGPTSPELTGPVGSGSVEIVKAEGLECAVPCYKSDCPENKCMSAISPERVLETIQRFIKQGS